MRRVIFLLLAPCLFSQDFHSTYRVDRDVTLHDFSIVEWNPKKLAFSSREDLPSIPKESRGRATYQFDGQYIYMVETPGTVMRMLYGFSLATPMGPQWFMHPHVSLKGNLRFLGADNLHVVMERTTRPEGKKPGRYQIQTLDLTAEKTDTLLDEEFQPALTAVSIVKDHAHILFLSDGRILEVDSQFGTLKEVASRFWQDRSDKFTDFVVMPDGKKIAQPAVFQGNPFFTRDGDVCIPMVIRETNVWTRGMMAASWADSNPEEQKRIIDQGYWPPKTDEYIGSDYVFVVFRYHPETHKTTILPADHYERLVERTRYVKQARLAKSLPNPLFFDDKEGVVEVRHFLELIAPPKGEKVKLTKP